MAVESLKEQIGRCEQAVNERPDSAVAHFNLGLAYTHRGYAGRAEKEYKRAVELDPELAEAWVNLGGALLMQWDFEAAHAAIERAIELREDLPLAHYNLGQACLYRGDAEGLVAANRRLLELDPEHAAGHYFLAVGLLALEEVEEARVELAHAMALGHRPAPEFLKKLHQAEEGLVGRVRQQENGGAEAPENQKEV